MSLSPTRNSLSVRKARRWKFPGALATLAGVAALVWQGLAVGGASGVVEFSRDIQPLLADRCYACHGPDENHRKAKLRLDTQAGALQSTNGKPAVVPGKSSAS